MLDLQFSYIPYISNSAFNMILFELEKAKFNKSGSNSRCAIFGDYAVLKTDGIPGHDDSFPQMIEMLQQLKEQDVNVVPILGYGVVQVGETFRNGQRYDRGYVIQEKAPGRELLSPSEIRHKSEEEKRNIIIDYFKLLSSVPQEHFDKWIADLKTLSDHKVAVDPSKASNFFYDSKKGFSFIDLNSFRKEPLFDKVDHNGQQRHAEFINYSFTPFRGAFYGYPFLEHLKNPDDVNFVKKVAAEAFRKTVTALKKIGITEADVDYTIQHFDIPFLKQLTQNDNIPESI